MLRGIRIGLAVAVLGTVAVAQTRSRDASIGVWPWLVGNIDSYATEIVSRSKAAGLDTIYLHLWRTTGPRKGELRIVDEPGTWRSSDGALIPGVTLSAFVQKAHAAGLQVVGVVQIFRSQSVFPDDYAHQDFMIQRVIRYLVHSYRPNGQRYFPLDGIALDYIRWFGGNHTSREVNRFLDALRAEVGPLPIHAYLPAGAFAVDGPTYDNRFRSDSAFRTYVIQNYGQDWAAMASRIDCILPMAYTANGHVYGSNLNRMQGYLQKVAEHARRAVRTAGSRCRVVPAIQTWNTSSVTTTQATVEACCKGAMAGGADGFMAFRYFTARPHASWFQGLARYSEPGPDWPVADARIVVDRIRAIVDTSRSAHQKVPTPQLRVRLDLDGDGVFDGSSRPVGSSAFTMRRPAGRLASARVEDPAGRSAVVTVRVDGRNILAPPTASVSLAAGGAVDLQLGPGTSQAGRGYIVFGALSTTPGTPVGPVTVPLNVDPLTVAIFHGRNSSMFPRFAGMIGFGGTAAPRFVLPPGVIPGFWAGTRLYFAAVGLGPAGEAVYASDPVQITLAR